MLQLLARFGDRVARLARTRAAIWVAPLVASVVTVLGIMVLLNEHPLRSDAPSGVRPGAYVAGALLAAGWAAVGVWTWRRVWREPEPDRWSTVVYGLGVRGFGLLMMLFMPLLSAVPFKWLVGWESSAPTPAGLALHILFSAAWWVIAGPWCGFAWGVLMAEAHRVPRTTADTPSRP